MSTAYQPLPDLAWDRFLAELPEEIVVDAEATAAGTRQYGPEYPLRVLTDGEDYLWAFKAPDGTVSFERYGANNAEQLIEMLEGAFGVELVSEHDERYFGLFGEEVEHGEDEY